MGRADEALNIKADNTANYVASKDGTREAYDSWKWMGAWTLPNNK